MTDETTGLHADLRAAILAPYDSAVRTEYRTVSMHKDGILWETERQLRWTTCAYIEDLAALVEMPAAPSVLAQLYVQRFYMAHAFSSHDRFLVATAALFLAGKSEEFPIKVRLLTECGMSLLYAPDGADAHSHHSHHNHRKSATSNGAPVRGRTAPAAAASSSSANAGARRRKSASGRTVEMSASLGNDPEAANEKHLDCLRALVDVVDVGQIETTASRVLYLERVLLQTLSFDLSIPQPFAYVSRCMEKLFSLDAMHPSIPYEAIRTIAFLFLSDAVKSGAVLAFNSVELAAAAVYLACLYRHHVSSNVATEKNDPWWTVWGLPAQQLEDAARGLLWTYEDNHGAKRGGVSEGMLDLWNRVRPDQNLPDLQYIKNLDADLVRS